MRVTRALLSVVVPALLTAQEPQPSLKSPQISASASAEVELKPDRATLVFTVESRGPTAAKAGSETARKQRAVIDTLRSLGIGADQMQTASVQISPEYVYPGENRPPRVSGYVARQSLRVEVQKIDMVGALIDGALTTEATGIGSLQFTSSKEPEARRQALALAVSKALGEAESMARAAGGSLGGLIELQAQPAAQRFDQPMAFAQASLARMKSESMPIATGQLTISATVSGRWGFSAK